MEGESLYPAFTPRKRRRLGGIDEGSEEEGFSHTSLASLPSSASVSDVTSPLVTRLGGSYAPVEDDQFKARNVMDQVDALTNGMESWSLDGLASLRAKAFGSAEASYVKQMQHAMHRRLLMPTHGGARAPAPSSRIKHTHLPPPTGESDIVSEAGAALGTGSCGGVGAGTSGGGVGGEGDRVVSMESGGFMLATPTFHHMLPSSTNVSQLTLQPCVPARVVAPSAVVPAVDSPRRTIRKPSIPQSRSVVVARTLALQSPAWHLHTGTHTGVRGESGRRGTRVGADSSARSLSWDASESAPLPQSRGYASDSCRRMPHTAERGISSNVRHTGSSNFSQAPASEPRVRTRPTRTLSDAMAPPISLQFDSSIGAVTPDERALTDGANASPTHASSARSVASSAHLINSPAPILRKRKAHEALRDTYYEVHRAREDDDDDVSI